MAKLRIGRRRESLFETLDSFGNLPEPIGVAVGVAPAFLIGNDFEAFAKGGGEIGKRGIHRKSLKRGGVWRKRPL